MTANDPAFPAINSFNPFLGLTKLEWYAGLAMQALIANPETVYGPTELRTTAYAAAKAMVAPIPEPSAARDSEILHLVIRRIAEGALFHGADTLSALSQIHELLVPEGTADATEELPPVVRPVDEKPTILRGRFYGITDSGRYESGE